MNIQQQLESLADRYRDQGYRVVVNPGPDDLPSFARDFQVELLAARPDENVLVSAKADPLEFERDPSLAGYAEAIEGQRGWRYDVTILGPPPPAAPASPTADEASEVQILRALDDSERLFAQGFAPQAVLTAWSALEAAMRHKVRALGGKAGFGTSPRAMLNELLSSGELTHGEYRDLEGFMSLRNVIAHGFRTPEIGPGSVSLLADMTRKLLAEPRLVGRGA